MDFCTALEFRDKFWARVHAAPWSHDTGIFPYSPGKVWYPASTSISSSPPGNSALELDPQPSAETCEAALCWACQIRHKEVFTVRVALVQAEDEAMDVPSLETFKVRLDKALSSLVWLKCPSSLQRGWTRQLLKVSSNPNHSLTLRSHKIPFQANPANPVTLAQVPPAKMQYLTWITPWNPKQATKACAEGLWVFLNTAGQGTLLLLFSALSYILICNSGAHNVFKLYRWSCWTILPWKTKLLLNKQLWTFSLPAHTASQHGLCHPAIKWSKDCLYKSHDHNRGLGTLWLLYFRLLRYAIVFQIMFLFQIRSLRDLYFLRF